MCHHGHVSTPQDEVIEHLKKASAARNRAAAALTRAREELQAVIFDARNAGVKQADIVKITGYNREHIRRLTIDEQKAREWTPPADHG